MPVVAYTDVPLFCQQLDQAADRCPRHPGLLFQLPVGGHPLPFTARHPLPVDYDLAVREINMFQQTEVNTCLVTPLRFIGVKVVQPIIGDAQKTFLSFSRVNTLIIFTFHLLRFKLNNHVTVWDSHLDRDGTASQLHKYLIFKHSTLHRRNLWDSRGTVGGTLLLIYKEYLI